MNNSPCNNCKYKLPNNHSCRFGTNECRRWVEWFEELWDETRNMIRGLAKKQEDSNDTQEIY